MYIYLMSLGVIVIQIIIQLLHGLLVIQSNTDRPFSQNYIDDLNFNEFETASSLTAMSSDQGRR